MRAHVCPECGTEREHDGRPGCPCAARAERSAEIAASEDFDPLRLRPYVTLENVGADPTPGAGAVTAGDPMATMPLRAVPGEPGAVPGAGAVPAGDPSATMPLRAVPAEPGAGPGAGPAFAAAAEGGTVAFAAVPGPVATGGSGEGGTYADTYVDPETDPREPVLRPATATTSSRSHSLRRRPLLLASVAAAAILAVGTAAFAGGGLLGGGHDDSAALPDTTVSTLPYGDTPSADSPTPSPTASQSSHGTPSASPSPRKSSPSPSRTAGPSPRPSRKSASPTPSPPKATGTVDSTTAPADRPATAPVLRRGDSGPEVAELQDRLAQLTIYDGNVDGRFGSKTERAVSTYQSYMGLDADPPGVYGPETRRALEAQTSQP